MEDAAVDLGATNEVHFLRHSSRCRMGVPPETKDPVLLHHPTRRSVVVPTDNARYHHARLHKVWRATHVEDFVLDYLPPYSPELNPIHHRKNETRKPLA